MILPPFFSAIITKCDVCNNYVQSVYTDRGLCCATLREKVYRWMCHPCSL